MVTVPHKMVRLEECSGTGVGTRGINFLKEYSYKYSNILKRISDSMEKSPP